MNFLFSLPYLASPPEEFDLRPASGFENLANVRFGGIVRWLVTLTLVIAGLAFFFMLVIGGIKWITSGGDKGQTEAARGQITAALIGLVIVFSAWAIIQLINSFFGVDLLNLTLPTAVE